MEKTSFYDLEFFAEETPIDVIMSCSIDRFELVGGLYGPFRELQRYTVPLWLAIVLKKHKKCSILPPEWLEADKLTSIYKSEQVEETDSFSSLLPPNYSEVSKLLFQYCSDNIPNVEKVRSQLDSIRKVRENSLAQQRDRYVLEMSVSLRDSDNNDTGPQFSHYDLLRGSGNVEVKSMLPFVTPVLEKLSQHRRIMERIPPHP